MEVAVLEAAVAVAAEAAEGVVAVVVEAAEAAEVEVEVEVEEAVAVVVEAAARVEAAALEAEEPSSPRSSCRASRPVQACSSRCRSQRGRARSRPG